MSDSDASTGQPPQPPSRPPTIRVRPPSVPPSPAPQSTATSTAPPPPEPADLISELDWRGTAVPAVRRSASHLWQPARLVTLFGMATTLVGLFLPYAEGITPYTTIPLQVTFHTLPNAPFLMLLVIGQALLVTSRGAARSRLQTVRLAPLAVGIAVAIVAVEIYRGTEGEISRWVRLQGSGSMLPGLWITLLGAAIVAAAGLWIGVRGPSDDETGDGRVSTALAARGRLVVGVATLVGAGFGALVGFEAGLSAMPGAIQAGHLVTLLGGGVAGGYLGRRLGRGLTLG